MKEFEQNDYAVNAETERRKTNRNAIISVLLAAVIVLMFFLGYYVRGISEPESSQKINEIINIIDNASIYGSDKTADELAKSLVEQLRKNGDNYAKYYTPEEYKRVLEEDKGLYSGIGIAFDLSGAIAKVYLNSSAYKAGIKTGDRLIAGVYKEDVNVDETEKKFTNFAEKVIEENAETEDSGDKDKKPEKSIFDIYSEFFAEFNAEEEFAVKIRRIEDDKETEQELTLKKSNYIVSYVEYKDNEKYYYFSTEGDGFKGREDDYTEFPDKKIDTLSSDTAYIKLYAFEGGAAEQFADALKFMKKQGKSKLILDLRDNGGGIIDILLDIASYLITDENGSSIIKVMGVEEKSSLTRYNTSKNNFDSFLTDISVIANCGTASAAEALIGALNDYGDKDAFKGAAFNLDRLVLTQKHGERDTYCTYGKGIMQTTYELKSGGALMLTTAYIYWPLRLIGEDEEKNSFCVQDIGIETNIEENQVTDAEAIARANEILK